MRTFLGVAAATWLMIVFAVTVLAGSLWAIWATRKTGVSSQTIVALATAVMGVVGTHVGHVTGQQLASREADAERLLAIIKKNDPADNVDAANKPRRARTTADRPSDHCPNPGRV